MKLKVQGPKEIFASGFLRLSLFLFIHLSFIPTPNPSKEGSTYLILFKFHTIF